MKIVAYTELVILARTIIGGIPIPFVGASNSLLAALFFAHFLRVRYYQSTFTQQAVKHVSELIEKEVKKPHAPTWAPGVWDKVKVIVGSWAGSTVITPAAPQPAPAPDAE